MSQKTGGALQMKPEELKEIRKRLGFTVDRMAFQMNTPRKTYENWEYGRARIPGIVEIFLQIYAKKV
jgi:DNA-binding transcriptional regulator YiaG